MQTISVGAVGELYVLFFTLFRLIIYCIASTFALVSSSTLIITLAHIYSTTAKVFSMISPQVVLYKGIDVI